MPSETFLREIEETDATLVALRQRLQALHDLAIYEELPKEAVTRIERKRNTVDLIRSQLAEVPDLADPRTGSR